jgi:hypothetical protein
MSSMPNWLELAIRAAPPAPSPGHDRQQAKAHGQQHRAHPGPHHLAPARHMAAGDMPGFVSDHAEAAGWGSPSPE